MDGQSSALYKFCDNVHDTNYRKLANTLKIILSCDEHDNSDADSDVGNSITTDCDNCAKLQNDRDRCIRLQTDSILKAADQENTIQSLQLQNKMYFDNLQTLTDDHNTLKATHLLCGTSGTGTVVCPGPAVDNLLVTQLQAELANCNRDLKTAKESETRTGTSVTKMGDQIKVMQQKNTELEQQLNAKTNDGHKVANTGIRNNCESEHWAARAHDCETIQEALRVENARLNAELTHLSAELVQTTNLFAHLTANAVNNSPPDTSVDTNTELAAMQTEFENKLQKLRESAAKDIAEQNQRATDDAAKLKTEYDDKLAEHEQTIAKHKEEYTKLMTAANDIVAEGDQIINEEVRKIQVMWKKYADGLEQRLATNNERIAELYTSNEETQTQLQECNKKSKIAETRNNRYKQLLSHIHAKFTNYINKTDANRVKLLSDAHKINTEYTAKTNIPNRRPLNTVVIIRQQPTITYTEYLEDLLQSVQTIMFDISISVMPYFQYNATFRENWTKMTTIHKNMPDTPNSVNVQALAESLHTLLNTQDLKPDAVETMQQLVEQIQQTIHEGDD